MIESVYQAKLIKKLRKLYPGTVILKNDSSYMPGIPDLSIFYNDRWVMLEVKAYDGADEQPNQRYYVDQLNAMSFAAFIFPENEKEVLHGVQQTLRASR